MRFSPQLACCAALLTAVPSVLAGCGGSGSSTNGQLIEPEPTTVGTVSAALARTAVLADVARARAVVDTSGATHAIQSIYTVINKAGAEKKAGKGAVILRAEIPPLVARFEADYQPTLDRLNALRFKTATGAEVRKLDLSVLRGWQKVLPELRSDLATKTYAWDAIVSFGTRNNKLSASLKAQLAAMLKKLPSAQRRLLAEAVKQTYGK